MSSTANATPLRDPRRSAIRWLARQLAWERTLHNLRTARRTRRVAA